MKDPWGIKEEDFTQMNSLSDKLVFILRYAQLAPSSHNTQPWKVKIDDNFIHVYADFERRLEVGDPTDRELYISIGHLLSHLIIAGKYFGFEATLDLFPSNKKGHVASVRLDEMQKRKKDAFNSELFKSITTRMTNRSLYKNKKIPTNFFLKIDDLMYENIDLVYVVKRDKIKELAELTQRGIEKAFNNKAFRDEVAMWIRHNWTTQKDGMPGYTLGIPDPVSIMAPAAIRASSIAKETSLEEKKMIESASAIGVLLAENDDKESWVKVGISASNFWLYSESKKISMAILSAAVEMPEERKKLKKILGTDKYPCLFFRLGYPTKKMRHSPRRDVEDFLMK